MFIKMDGYWINTEKVTYISESGHGTCIIHFSKNNFLSFRRSADEIVKEFGFVTKDLTKSDSIDLSKIKQGE